MRELSLCAFFRGTEGVPRGIWTGACGTLPSMLYPDTTYVGVAFRDRGFLLLFHFNSFILFLRYLQHTTTLYSDFARM